MAFVRGIHRSPVNSPHKGPVTRKMFPFDDVIMLHCYGAITGGKNDEKQTPTKHNKARGICIIVRICCIFMSQYLYFAVSWNICNCLELSTSKIMFPLSDIAQLIQTIFHCRDTLIIYVFDGFLQQRRNSIANAVELGLSCTNPSFFLGLCSSWLQNKGIAEQSSSVYLGTSISNAFFQ